MLQLLKFAEDRGIDKNALGTISLGQGQVLCNISLFKK